METICPFAEWRPLGRQTEQRIGVPRIFIVHTMIGYLAGTEAMFRRDGYSGTESTFGIGGSWDGDLDGAIWQWQDLAHSADANFDANAYATSVETSDGGKLRVGWSARQAESLIKLGVWWCKATGNPAKLVTSPDGRGFGWHAQFREWNRTAHDCPGAVRLGQYKSEIVPEIARRLAGEVPPAPAPPWPGRLLRYVPGERLMQGTDVHQWQAQMRRRGWTIDVDGMFGPGSRDVAMRFQREKRIDVDGIVGRVTWTATFEMPIT